MGRGQNFLTLSPSLSMTPVMEAIESLRAHWGSRGVGRCQGSSRSHHCRPFAGPLDFFRAQERQKQLNSQADPILGPLIQPCSYVIAGPTGLHRASGHHDLITFLPPNTDHISRLHPQTFLQTPACPPQSLAVTSAIAASTRH